MRKFIFASMDYDKCFEWMAYFTKETEALFHENALSLKELYKKMKEINHLEILPLGKNHYAVYKINDEQKDNESFWEKTKEIAFKHGFNLTYDGDVPFWRYEVSNNTNEIDVLSNLYLSDYISDFGHYVNLFDNEYDAFIQGGKWIKVSSECIYYATFWDIVKDNIAMNLSIDCYDLEFHRTREIADCVIRYGEMMEELKSYWETCYIPEIPFIGE